MKCILFGILLFSAFVSFAQQKQVCFSLDDLPLVTYGMNDTTFQLGLMEKLISSLQTNGIPAIGFVNAKKLYDEKGQIPFQMELLNRWVTAGLELGNHTYSHFDYNKVSWQVYTQDLLKGESGIRKLLFHRPGSTRFFRHPFLHTGNTKEKSDSLNRFLSAHGYRVAPVTIDNDDYLFAVAYKRAKVKNEAKAAEQIGEDYLRYMEKKVKYYEGQSEKLFGRMIPQILLIHASWLNSDCLNSLAAMFRKNGYGFMAMDESLKDKAYTTEITTFGNYGISWLDRWALSQGKKGDFFQGDPTVPEYIKTLSAAEGDRKAFPGMNASLAIREGSPAKNPLTP